MTHKNSLEAYREGTKNTFKGRSQAVFEAFWYNSKQLTDRECLKLLKPYSDNINYCQPRITELTKEGILEECGTKYENGRPVRVSRVKQTQPQTELF